MRAYAQALRPAPARNEQALPNALARAQAKEVIERASFCAPEFVDVEPALGTMGQGIPMAFGWDNTPPPPPVPAGPEVVKDDTGKSVSKSDTGKSVSVETPTAEPVPRTGKFGRPIITLKKSRRLK
jgi:hypothetical protein